MHIANGSITFPSIKGGLQQGTAQVDMGASVTQAAAFLAGFNVEFSNQDDHDFGLLDVQVRVPAGGVSGSSVKVQVTYGLRDWSGDWDDLYQGEIFFTVVGE